MSFKLQGIAREVLEQINRMTEAAGNGGNIFYEGVRQGPGAGTIRITRIEIIPQETAVLSINLIDARPLGCAPSQTLYNHSPNGFEWGEYNHAGAAQLALALLLDATKDKVLALKYHQDFKEKFVARWGSGWRIDAGQIRCWVKLRQFHETFKEANAGGEEPVY